MQENRVTCLTFLVAKGVNDCDWLHLKRRAAVLAEHGADCIEHYLGLCQVRCRDLYEDILCVQADLRHMGTLDDIATDQLNMWRLGTLQNLTACREHVQSAAACCRDHELPCRMLRSRGDLHIGQGSTVDDNTACNCKELSRL